MSNTATYSSEEIDQSSYGLELMPEVSQPVPTPQPPKLKFECLCPFCGSFNSEIGKPCTTCQTEDTSAMRTASTKRTGAWYLLQPNNRDTPGMDFDELLKLIRNHRVIPTSVLRGPTTGQLWRLASRVRGISREFGQCYSCSGDIETGETICPHCDRMQTIPEHGDMKTPSKLAVSPAQFLVQDPEPVKQVRDALIGEPVIHVHSLSNPDHKPIDPIMTARPVMAECSERHIPKDDLLTPREVAKAFQLEFSPQADEINRFLAKPGFDIKKLKVAMTSVTALAVAGLLLWPVTRIVSGLITDNQARAVAGSLAPDTATPSTDPQPNLVALGPIEQPIFPAITAPPIRTTAVLPAAPPAVAASSVMAPAIVPESSAATSVQDDPTHLWNSALDAESTRNFPAAVAAYERIESLPSDAWPANLEVRLQLARRELKGDLR